MPQRLKSVIVFLFLCFLSTKSHSVICVCKTNIWVKWVIKCSKDCEPHSQIDNPHLKITFCSTHGNMITYLRTLCCLGLVYLQPGCEFRHLPSAELRGCCHIDQILHHCVAAEHYKLKLIIYTVGKCSKQNSEKDKISSKFISLLYLYQLVTEPDSHVIS